MIQREICVIGSVPAFLLNSLDERGLPLFGDFPAVLVGELLRLIFRPDKTVDGKVAGAVLGEDSLPVFLAGFLEMHPGAAELVFCRIEVLASLRAFADDDRVSVVQFHAVQGTDVILHCLHIVQDHIGDGIDDIGRSA